MKKSVQQTKTNGTKTTKAPTQTHTNAPWRPRLEHSGIGEQQSMADAIRQQAAWVALVREQLDHDGDTGQAVIDLGEAVSVLLRLSLEAESLEHAANQARAGGTVTS